MATGLLIRSKNKGLLLEFCAFFVATPLITSAPTTQLRSRRGASRVGWDAAEQRPARSNRTTTHTSGVVTTVNYPADCTLPDVMDNPSEESGLAGRNGCGLWWDRRSLRQDATFFIFFVALQRPVCVNTPRSNSSRLKRWLAAVAFVENGKEQCNNQMCVSIMNKIIRRALLSLPRLRQRYCSRVR